MAFTGGELLSGQTGMGKMGNGGHENPFAGNPYAGGWGVGGTVVEFSNWQNMNGPSQRRAIHRNIITFRMQ